MMMPSNLFLAIVPPDQVRDEVEHIARKLGIRMPHGGRAVSREKYHLTMRYLGQADSLESAEVAAVVRQAMGKVQAGPFSMTLKVANSFRTSRKMPWWVGPTETPAGLALLHEKIAGALSTAKVPSDRSKFIPHLTVVRDAVVALPTTPIKPIEWAVGDFVLLRSFLLEDRAGYEEIGRWPLGAGSPDVRSGQLDLL